jgi:NAD(P)H dehydrogenase (quinone)
VLKNSPLLGGKWFSAAGDGKLASISRDDLARAAAIVLAGPYADKATMDSVEVNAF